MLEPSLENQDHSAVRTKEITFRKMHAKPQTENHKSAEAAHTLPGAYNSPQSSSPNLLPHFELSLAEHSVFLEI
jgi:hypothetical protein